MFKRKNAVAPSPRPALTLADRLSQNDLVAMARRRLAAGDVTGLVELLADHRANSAVQRSVLEGAIVGGARANTVGEALGKSNALAGELRNWVAGVLTPPKEQCELNALYFVLRSLASAKAPISTHLMVLQGAGLLRQSSGSGFHVWDCRSGGLHSSCRLPGGSHCGVKFVEARDLGSWAQSLQSLLAGNPSTAGEVLDVLVTNCDDSVKLVLASRPELSTESLAALDATGRAMAIAARAARSRGSSTMLGATPEFAYAHTALSGLNSRLAAAQRTSLLMSAHLGRALPDSVMSALESATQETMRLVRLYDEILSGECSDHTHKVLAVVLNQADAALTQYERFTEVLTELSGADMEEARREKFEELCAQVLGWAEVRSVEGSTLVPEVTLATLVKQERVALTG